MIVIFRSFKIYLSYNIKFQINIRLTQFRKMKKTKSLKGGEYQYNQKDHLGEGSFASVYKGIITKNNRVIAVRLLPLNLIKQYGDKIKEIIRGQVQVLKELSLSSSQDAIFTTKIYDCFMTENNVVMILQFCPEGNLQDIIKKGALSQKEALPIVYQLARGLQFIASEKVVHRDIKPDNIFIKRQNQHMIFKLGDFGFAVKKQLNQEIVGTPIFMSPQLFREIKYGSEVDVWAFGLMVHYMLFKQYYFIGASQKIIKQKVLNEQYTLKKYHLQKISHQMADFLNQCLQIDKNKRIPANRISEHPVFRPVENSINQMIAEVRFLSSKYESQLLKRTAKGKSMDEILKFSFLRDLGCLFAKYDTYNLASLYIFKYNLGELSFFKQEYEKRKNVIHHQEWEKFCASEDYQKIYELLSKVIQQNQQYFENSFNTLIPIIQQRYGPSVSKGICDNLGSGPMARINPQIPAHQIKNNWLPKLTQNKTVENYQLSLECMMALSLLEGKQVDFDFTSFEMQKMKLSAVEKSSILEQAFKKSKMV